MSVPIPQISIVYTPQPVMRDGSFEAKVHCDLRHSDAVVLAATGPVEVEVGGAHAEEFLPEKKERFFADKVLRQSFSTLEGAQAWQASVGSQVVSSMRARRQMFEALFPGHSWERYVEV